MAPTDGSEPRAGVRHGRRPGRLRLVLVAGAAALAVVLVVAFVAQRRRLADFEHTVTRVQAEAQTVGDGIDLESFRSSWADHVAAGQAPGQDAALVPPIAGAEVVAVNVTTGPSQVVIDYQVSGGGEQACIRVTRTASGTDVTEAEVDCPSFTFTPIL